MSPRLLPGRETRIGGQCAGTCSFLFVGETLGQSQVVNSPVFPQVRYHPPPMPRAPSHPAILSWSLLLPAPRGCSFQLLVLPSWPLVAAPGSSWLLLACPGSSWLLAPRGCFWLPLAPPVASWLAPPGFTWLLLAPPWKPLLALLPQLLTYALSWEPLGPLQAPLHLQAPPCYTLVLVHPQAPPGPSGLLQALLGFSFGAPAGSSQLLLAPPGSSWLLLVPPGCSWLLPVPPSCSWLLLAPLGSTPAGSCQLLLAPLASSWPLLAPPGSSWHLLAAPGSPWLLPASPGSSWLLLAPPSSSCFLPASSWLLLASPGSSWLRLVSPGPSWLLLLAPPGSFHFFLAPPSCSCLLLAPLGFSLPRIRQRHHDSCEFLQLAWNHGTPQAGSQEELG